MAAKRKKFSDQLRQAIKESELTQYQISKRTGVDKSVLSKFVRGERGLSIESIDLLYECLRLNLTKKPTTKRQRKR